MSVNVADNPDRHRYEIRVDGEVAGVAEYEPGDEAITFTHTEVDARFKGQGLGSRLARGALDDVRARGLAAVPRCEFVRGFIASHDEYLELVPEGEREALGLEAGA